MQRSVQRWKDYQLTWNESDYGGVSSIVVPASSIWTPDILLYNRCVHLFTRPILFTLDLWSTPCTCNFGSNWPCRSWNTFLSIFARTGCASAV